MSDVLKVEMGVALAVTAVVVIAAGVIYWKRDDIAAALGAVNPASPNNFVYQGVNGVGAALTGRGDGSFTLGSWLYDVTHPFALKADAPMGGPRNNDAYGPQSVYELPGVFFP